MKFPGGFNPMQMMKEAQKMQERMGQEMNAMQVEASAGGGMVTVKATGGGEIVGITIDPKAIDPDDPCCSPTSSSPPSTRRSAARTR